MKLVDFFIFLLFGLICHVEGKAFSGYNSEVEKDPCVDVTMEDTNFEEEMFRFYMGRIRNHSTATTASQTATTASQTATTTASQTVTANASQTATTTTEQTTTMRNPYDIEKIKYFLYPKNGESVQVTPENISFTSFSPIKPTKILIHGWMSSSKAPSVTLIQKEYNKHKDYNVLACDWSELADDIWYADAAHATEWVGMHLGLFINQLVIATKTSFTLIHLIGHSLGAHIAAAAGKSLNGRLSRITSLDPAAPCFLTFEPCSMYDPASNISPGDAKFVDVIHTSGGFVGMSTPLGHADFYPNGGLPIEPGCENFFDPLSAFVCSHGRSFEFFAESISSSDFKALKCHDLFSFIMHTCNDTVYVMGDPTPAGTVGQFFLMTAASSPYALSDAGLYYGNGGVDPPVP